MTFNKTFKKAYFICIFLTLNTVVLSQSVSIEQEPEFQEMLNEKRKINASLNISDRWKIQIFSGNNESSRKALTDFRKEFKSVDATIIFQTPNYKVIAGNFRARIEAERVLLEVKNKYPDAFLIKPDK
ncbi:MAG: SPOR domain-containing protein [Flavobacterium sp.]